MHILRVTQTYQFRCGSNLEALITTKTLFIVRVIPIFRFATQGLMLPLSTISSEPLESMHGGAPFLLTYIAYRDPNLAGTRRCAAAKSELLAWIKTLVGTRKSRASALSVSAAS